MTSLEYQLSLPFHDRPPRLSQTPRHDKRCKADFKADKYIFVAFKEKIADWSQMISRK